MSIIPAYRNFIMNDEQKEQGIAMNLKVETHTVENSATILRADYDNLLGTLDVHFKSGSVYQYVAVPRSVYLELIEAPSAGKYFHTNVKGKYEFLKRTVKL